MGVAPKPCRLARHAELPPRGYLVAPQIEHRLHDLDCWYGSHGIKLLRSIKIKLRTGRGRRVDTQRVARTGHEEAEGFFWPKGWWSVVDFKIGIIPLPVFVILMGVIAGFVATGTVPSDILMAIVLLSMGGFTCAELGKRIPLIRNIGAGRYLPLSSHRSWPSIIYCRHRS